MLPTNPASLQNWLAYLETLHPKVIDLGLARIQQVAERINLLPFPSFVITVAGTNGKGTSVALLEAILLTEGLRVGTYTSPHLIQYNERIKINGIPVSDADLCHAFSGIEQARGETSLTYFEFGTLAALQLFKQAQLDVVILEVGLGGRLDAVNIIDANIALITTIALDHMDYLGSDREAIGTEKAGIMRAHKPVVCGDFAPPASISDYANQIQAQLYLYGHDYFYQQSDAQHWEWRNTSLELTQLPVPAIPLQNAAAVLQILALLSSKFTVTQAAIEQGLANVRVPGRFQVFPGDVTCIMDVAHNPAAATYLAQQLHALPCSGNTFAVFSMLNDKDQLSTVKSLAPEIAEWYVGSLQVPRGATAIELAQVLLAAGVSEINVSDTIAVAYRSAMKNANAGDRILVFGSFYTVAQVMQLRL